MKYALIGPKKAIRRVSDTPITRIPPDHTVVEITDEQADQAVAALAIRTFVFYDEGALVERPPDAVLTPEERYRKVLDRGYDTGYGFRIGTTMHDQMRFTQMALLVHMAVGNGTIPANAPQTFADMVGALHTVTATQFQQLMIAYGNYLKQCWDTYMAAKSV